MWWLAIAIVMNFQLVFLSKIKTKMLLLPLLKAYNSRSVRYSLSYIPFARSMVSKVYLDHWGLNLLLLLGLNLLNAITH
uniref:Uncharacterized protein n=1 Tax=Cucumis melo TaxID=3656 RepID=A0A9I9EK91_CUCME